VRPRGLSAYLSAPEAPTLAASLQEPGTVRLIDLLDATAQELVSRVDAQACAISRALGDVLIVVTNRSPHDRLLQLGAGYLISDYPLTAEVLETRQPRALTLEDDSVDPQEAAVLSELGFASLALLPLELHGLPWGLVEIYRSEPTPFTNADLRWAGEIVARTAARVA
jgi:GAF domain-containing protein